MARICPNLANGWIVACVRGIAATIVVMALLKIDTPIWLMAALVLHCLDAALFWNYLKKKL
jgi:alpha-D-ribose 1-methylphosphonate 5-triphosphate synthase subunit PhnH